MSADTAFRVAEALRVDGPWEVFGERSRRYEIHFNGRSIEMVRGPISLEGYSLGLFRQRDGGAGVGFQASTDLSGPGIVETVADAESLCRYSSFPAKSISLPETTSTSAEDVEVLDPHLWDRPMETLQAYVHALLEPFDGLKDVLPSFGSVRATLAETTIANSTGLQVGYPQSVVEVEVAVKAVGGPEGPGPGEYWVNDNVRRLEPSSLGPKVEEWCQYARDVRKAAATPTGNLPVVLPSSVLSGILPPVIGSRFTGRGRLRETAPAIGEKRGCDALTIWDDGRIPWAVPSSPVDDEGTPHGRRKLLSQGQVSELMYDVLYAGAFDLRSTGNAARGIVFGFRDWRRFLYSPAGTSTTLVIEPGTDGTDTELIEAAGDGIWLQQLGWAIPDPLSGAFGGEIRIGYRIRHGKLAEPVRGGTVGGVVMAAPGNPSLLANIGAIGSMPSLSEGIFAPALLVKPLTVAGS